MGWIICRASVSVVGLSASAGHSSGVVPFPGVDDDSLPKTGEGQGGFARLFAMRTPRPRAASWLVPVPGRAPRVSQTPPPLFFGH